MIGIRAQQTAFRETVIAEVGCDGSLISSLTAGERIVDGYVYEAVVDDDVAIAFVDKLTLEGYKVESMPYGWIATKWVRTLGKFAENVIRVWVDIDRLDEYPHIEPILPLPHPCK